MIYEQAFIDAFIYLAAALVAVLLGKRLGLGAVLGYLIIGALIGPWGLKLIGSEGEQVMHFAEFGVVMMLFLVGLELQPQMLWSMRKRILGLGTLQVVASAMAIAGAVMLLGQNWRVAFAVGLILAMSSTAIVLQSLSERGLMRTEAGQSSFAVLLFQDIAVIPIMAALPLLALAAPAKGESGHEHGAGGNYWMQELPGWAQAVTTIAAVLLVVLLARWLTRPLFRAIAATRQREAFTATALLLVIGVALLMTKVGLSPALGAFVAGVVLASSEYRHELESDLAPFKGLLLGLFFLGVGIGIDFGHIAANWLLVLGLTLGLLILKGAILWGLAKFHGVASGASILFAAALAAGGEFAFVLITLALGSGVFGEEISRTLVAVVAVSMALTPLLILASVRWNERKAPVRQSSRAADVQDEHSPVILCGFGRFGHAVGRLIRSQGISCTVLDHDEDQVETLRLLGIPVYYGDAARTDLLEIAGAARARVIVIALRSKETTERIIHAVKREFPHLKIFLRAHGRLEAYEYLEMGEDRIYRDTLDSSLSMGVDVLRELGIPAYAAGRAAKIYRKADEAAVRMMAKHRNVRTRYLHAGRQSIQAFEEVMRGDASEPGGDKGWSPPLAPREQDSQLP
jgi:monovalent cation:H+ antiporter-2, CPA2 family